MQIFKFPLVPTFRVVLFICLLICGADASVSALCMCASTDGAMVSPALFFVVGATGSGKSAAAVHIAHTLRIEYGYDRVVIVNCDVTQFYDDLAVATNKPTAAQMGGIPHLFLGFLSSTDHIIHDPATPYEGRSKLAAASVSAPAERPSVGSPYHIHQYVRDVTRFIDAYAREPGRCAVILCGGTCYYMQALLFEHTIWDIKSEGSSDEVSLATAVAASRDDEHSCDVTAPSCTYLWDQLNAIDPAVAARFHPHDSQRLRRLLQIYRQTNTAPSEIFASHPPQLRYDISQCFVIWIDVPRETLMHSIDTRVDSMVRCGLLDEARAFYAKSAHYHDAYDIYLSSSLNTAIGYKEFISVLTESRCHQDGNIKTACAFPIAQVGTEDALCASISPTQSVSASPLPNVDSAIASVKSNTRRYARQQQRWLSNRFTKLWVEATKSNVAREDSQHWKHFAKLHITSSSERRRVINFYLSSVFKQDESNVNRSNTISTKSECISFPAQAHISHDSIVATPQWTVSDHYPQTHQTRCYLCDVFVCSAAQWKVHLQSKRHRGAIKRQALEREHRIKYGKELPPSKRRKG